MCFGKAGGGTEERGRAPNGTGGDALECVGDGLGEGEEEREGEEEGVPEEEMNWVDMGSALTAQQIPAKPKYVD